MRGAQDEQAHLGVEIGAAEGAAHSDPARADVVILPEQLQAPLALQPEQAFEADEEGQQALHKVTERHGAVASVHKRMQPKRALNSCRGRGEAWTGFGNSRNAIRETVLPMKAQ
jgi:hypothetical protein